LKNHKIKTLKTQALKQSLFLKFFQTTNKLKRN